MSTDNEQDCLGIKITKYILSFLFIYTISGMSFYLVESLVFGSSNWQTFVSSGICGLGFALINDSGYRFETDYRIQVTTGAALCTFLKFLMGIIFNSNFEIWDYRGLFGTLKVLQNQINIYCVILWLVIACFAIPTLDFVQWQLGIGAKPYYRIGKKYFYPFGKVK